MTMDKTSEPVIPQTLVEAHEVLARIRPGRQAPLTEWLAYYPHSSALYADIADRTIELGKQAKAARRRRPSMAEYLDTVRACIAYDERPPDGESAGSALWEAIEEAALRKTRAARSVTSGE